MTQPPDRNRPDWTPPAWTPPPPRGQQHPQQGPQHGPQQGPPPQYGPPSQYGPPPQYGPPQQHFGAPPQQPGDGSWELAPGNPPQRPAGHRSRTIALIVAAVVVVAAVAGGVFLLRGGDDKSATGGAATPQAAITGFADDVAKQDVDGLLSYVDPAESRPLGAFIGAARGKFSSTGVVAATGVPAPFLNVVLSGVQVQIDKVRSDLAFATVSDGSAAVTADPRKVPQVVSGGKTEPKTTTVQLAQGLNGTRVGVVEVGGRWYVSPTTTLLEAIRKQTGLPAPDFTIQPTTTGGDDPEGAVSGLVNALNQKDVRGAAGFFSSKEIPALPYYYDVFASQLKGRQAQFNVTISDLDLSTEDMTNGLKKVTVKGATLAGGDEKVSYADGCATVQGQQRCVPSNIRTLFGLSQPFFVVEQNGAKWQISPIATITEYLRTILADGDKNALLRRINGEMVAPVAASVKVGDKATVQLNEAGFAHVVITGAAGTCFDARLSNDDEQYLDVDGTAYSSKCANYAIPSSGKVDAAILQSSLTKGTAEIEVTKE